MKEFVMERKEVSHWIMVEIRRGKWAFVSEYRPGSEKKEVRKEF